MISSAASKLPGAPDQPDIRYPYAVALHRSGSTDEARTLLDEVLAGGGQFESRADAEALRREL